VSNAIRVFKNVNLKGYDGKDIQVAVNEEGSGVVVKEAKMDFALRLILANAPIQTQDDSIQGARLAQALDEAKGKKTVEIGEGVHDWLKRVAEKVTPVIFRQNGNEVYKHICEGFEKAKEPAEEKGK